MKTRNIILPAILLASGLTAAAQTPDTLRVKNVNEVVVVTSRNEQTVSLKGSANDSTFRYESRVSITSESDVSVRENRLDLFSWDILQDRRDRRMNDTTTVSGSHGTTATSKSKSHKRYSRVYSTGLDYVGAGFAFPYDGPAGMEIGGTALSDIFVNIESVKFRFAWNHMCISSGLNAGYRSFRLMDEGILVRQDGKVVKAAIPHDLELKRSALRSNYLSVPALLGLSIGRNGMFELYGGAEICFNFNGRIKNKYSQDQSAVPTKFTDIHLERFTWNYIAGINFCDLGVYAKYSPCPFLAEGYGPSFNTYSIGVILDL